MHAEGAVFEIAPVQGNEVIHMMHPLSRAERVMSSTQATLIDHTN